MKNKLFVLLCLSGLFMAQAQEAVLTAGGNGAGNGSISYSVGQLVYTSQTTGGVTISQGVQQPIEVYTLSHANPTPNLLTKVYPNPSYDVLVLSFSNRDTKSTIYELYDIAGKLVAQGMITDIETHISVKNLTAGTYILKVHQNSQHVQSFRIIKK